MKKYILIALLITTQVNATQICGTLEQAGLIVVDDKDLIAFTRDANLSQNINNINITLKKIDWDIQDIKGVPQKTVTPSSEHQSQIIKESTQIKQAYKKKVDKKYWQNGFVKPLEGRTSGKYGGQRIYNGTKKNPHLGVDIARPTGTPVVASGDGIVVGTIKDGFFNGNLVIINHGDNLTTVYAHLNQINVKDGEEIKKGDIIGLVGSTGRSTGPHLHFGANLGGIKFNPKNLYEIKNTNTCKKY